MTYLFDVNALIALGFLQHEFSDRLAAWIASQQSLTIATCPITETGFVRVPSWVRSPKHVTDGHLVQLAAAHSIALATFDKSIPGAFLIP